jgi:competence protein ComEA
MPIKLYSQLGLTQSEFKLLLFVFFSFIFGLVLNLMFNVSNKSRLLNFEYTLEDSLFFSFNDENQEGNSENKKQNVAYKEEVLDFNSAKFENVLKKVLPPLNSINLNSATKSELTKLPGIGEKTAEAIIKLREKMGKFWKLEDLKKVKGIGHKKFEKIKPYIFIK